MFLSSCLALLPDGDGLGAFTAPDDPTDLVQILASCMVRRQKRGCRRHCRQVTLLERVEDLRGLICGLVGRQERVRILSAELVRRSFGVLALELGGKGRVRMWLQGQSIGIVLRWRVDPIDAAAEVFARERGVQVVGLQIVSVVLDLIAVPGAAFADLKGVRLHVLLLLLSELLLILLLVLLVHEGQEVGLLVHMLLTKAEVLFVLSGFLNEFQSASGLLFGTDRQGIVSHQRAFLGQPASELICCKRCRSSRIIHHESIRPQVHVKGRAIRG